MVAKLKQIVENDNDLNLSTTCSSPYNVMKAYTVHQQPLK